MVLFYKKLNEKAATPERKHSEDAGADLCSCEDVEIPAGECRTVHTGISVMIPHKCVGYVCSRSGLAAKYSVFVLNAPGVVDCGYTGEVCVILMNAGKYAYNIKVGDRIAQLVVQPIELPYFHEVANMKESPATERGDGGFGSTGV